MAYGVELSERVCRARELAERLGQISIEAWEEARVQAGLPETWLWANMTEKEAHRLSVACQIRLLEVA